MSLPRRPVDLQVHSDASDGILPPAQVLAAAAAAGLDAIALTDHDTLDGLPEARQAGDALGVRVIAGVELSAFDAQGREVHLLGLHLSDTGALEPALHDLRIARRERAERIVARLAEVGAPITLESVLGFAGRGAVGRPHVARALVAAGHARDHRDAFDRFIGAGRPANVDKVRLTVADAIALIHGAGGLAVWAHPAGEGRRERLEPYVALGLDGVEVLHPSHGGEDIKRLRTLVEFLGLVPSGGSDWHGQTEGARRLGMMDVPHEYLERQEARVRARAAVQAAHGTASPREAPEPA